MSEIANFNFIGFNQDAKALSIGHRAGFSLYSLANVLDKPVLQYENETVTDTLLLERMFMSSFLTFVSRKNPRLLQIYHITNRALIYEHKFSSSILNVKMNRERLIICLEECLHVFSIKEVKQVMHTICDTPANRSGLIDLCAGPSLLAYPGSTTTGQVNIFDATSLTSVTSFTAHANPLSAVRFNAEGNKIATASSKGTVIRVFSVPNATKLFEFQRGVRPCAMHSLCFSADSTYLCSSSNTETIHVYKLAKTEEKTQTEASGGGWFSYLQQTANAYLNVGELLRETDFAVARLPASQKTMSAMTTISGHPHLLVASTDGFLYCFRVPAEGGQCELIKQHRVGGTRGFPSSTENSLNEFPPLIHHSGH